LPLRPPRMATRWIRRTSAGKGRFRFLAPDGRPVRDSRTLDRIDRIRIPPAWRDVHVASSQRCAIQAWGYDARGRRQYRYHPSAVARGELRKYYRVRALGEDLPRIRARVRADSRRPTLSRDTVAALVVRLIAEGFFRPGSDRSTRENRTYGITTMRKKHVSAERGSIVFRYVGKGGVRQRQVITGRELTASIRRLLATRGARLFRFRDGSGWHDLTAREVNEYLRERLGVAYSAKDFRTWGGTLRAATVLGEIGDATSRTARQRNVALAMRLVAAELGNTPAICRKSYVHPIVVARYLDDGETIDLAPRRRARGSTAAHSPEERSLLGFLHRHFPERRRSTRSERGSSDAPPKRRQVAPSRKQGRRSAFPP
jgi:DNA topoisomerase I